MTISEKKEKEEKKKKKLFENKKKMGTLNHVHEETAPLILVHNKLCMVACV